jgi:hypothetical protein
MFEAGSNLPAFFLSVMLNLFSIHHEAGTATWTLKHAQGDD